MARETEKTGCGLSGTGYCQMLNMPDCTGCSVRTADAEQVKQDLDALQKLLPEDGVSDLFHTDACRLCRGEQKNPCSCYALVDLGNPQPARRQRNAIGLHGKAKMGSIIPVQIACCSACKKRLRILEYLPTVLPLSVAAVTLLLMMIRPVADGLQRLFQAMPMVVFLSATAIAYGWGRIITKRLRAKYEAETILDLMELPKMQELERRGWFPLNTSKKPSRPVFLKKPLAAGVCTGIPLPDAKTGADA